MSSELKSPKPSLAPRLVSPDEERVRRQRKLDWVMATSEFVGLLKENFEMEQKMAKNRARLEELQKLPHLKILKNSFANSGYNQKEKEKAKKKKLEKAAKKTKPASSSQKEKSADDRKVTAKKSKSGKEDVDETTHLSGTATPSGSQHEEDFNVMDN